MSVMNQSGEEQVECPLCMEPLEVDDLNFFPCTCGYQICRFCWHRIRTDENGLCPACRKAYSENPADFIPLSKEQVAQLKAEKRQRDQQRKAKLSESRKHLASVRVVQRNLVFVVGLPMRLADPEVLKKYEYFGKFGKIHKVVINQSTSYAGTQGPSASAYVTYMKSDDALRAIQNVNNTIMDGKTIKTSLGTTKYCSHFMKNQPCPKPDCMYLHDFGDQEASFTKEQMHAGKHQEYEKKLHDALVSKLATAATTNGTNQNGAVCCGGGIVVEQPPQTQKQPPPPQQQQQQQPPPSKPKDGVAAASQNGGASKENWPQLNTSDKPEGGGGKKDTNKAEKDTKKAGRKGGGNKPERRSDKKSPPPPTAQPLDPIKPEIIERPAVAVVDKDDDFLLLQPVLNNTIENNNTVSSSSSSNSSSSKLPAVLDDNSSFFSQNSFTKLAPDGADGEDDASLLLHQHNESSLLEINDTDSWEFDFGYTKHSNHLEELAKQRITVKDGGLDVAFDFGAGPTAFGLPPDTFNTENLLETLAKNSVNYSQSMQQQQAAPPAYNNKDLNGLDQHMSKFFTDFYSRNGYSSPQQQQPPPPPVGLSQHMNNGYHHHNHHQQQQQQMNLANKHTLALLQQQRQIEEQLMSLSMNGKQVAPPQQQQQQQQQHGYGHMNGGYELQNGGMYGFGNSVPTAKSRPIQEDKELDFRFQEAQKALEELVESDSHMHNNSGRNAIGSNQMNGLVHSQSGSHLPPPPGFVQSTTHMNSFGSKILPYLNMNSQQQQMNTTQNSWPSNFSQMQQQQQNQQQQQQQQHKGMGMCNDWKFLDPAILSSRRHIPNMPPLILDHYSPLQQLGGIGAPSQQPPQPQQPRSSTFDTYGAGGGGGGFPSYTPLQQSYNNYSHLSAQQNLNWLGSEINTQISSPPGFRTPGQATKQQEC